MNGWQETPPVKWQALPALQADDPTHELRAQLRDELRGIDGGESWMQSMAPGLSRALQPAAVQSMPG